MNGLSDFPDEYWSAENWSAAAADVIEQRVAAWPDSEDDAAVIPTSLPDDQPEADRLEQELVVPLDEDDILG
jgi:hypothetical protein